LGRLANVSAIVNARFKQIEHLLFLSGHSGIQHPMRKNHLDGTLQSNDRALVQTTEISCRILK